MREILKVMSLGVVAAAGLAGCAAKQDVQRVDAQVAAPINCATAEGDIRVLQSEKESAAEEIASGVTALVPASAVVGVVSGQEGDKFEIASGEYNTMIDKRIAAIRSQCKLPAQPAS